MWQYHQEHCLLYKRKLIEYPGYCIRLNTDNTGCITKYEKHTRNDRQRESWLWKKFPWRSQKEASKPTQVSCHYWGHWIRCTHNCSLHYCAQHSEEHCEWHSEIDQINTTVAMLVTWSLKIAWLLICLAAKRVICFELANLFSWVMKTSRNHLPGNDWSRRVFELDCGGFVGGDRYENVDCCYSVFPGTTQTLNLTRRKSTCFSHKALSLSTCSKW